MGHICILYPVGHLSIVSPSMKNVSTSESKSTLGYPFSLIGPICRHMWAVCRCPLVSDAVRISQNAATNLPRPQTASHRIPPHPTAFPFTCTGLATSKKYPRSTRSIRFGFSSFSSFQIEVSAGSVPDAVSAKYKLQSSNPCFCRALR